MVCELKIKELERELGRKLTEKEKKNIRQKMEHVDIEDESREEEIEVAA